MGCSVAGSTEVKVLPDAASIHRPPMSSFRGVPRNASVAFVGPTATAISLSCIRSTDDGRTDGAYRETPTAPHDRRAMLCRATDLCQHSTYPDGTPRVRCALVAHRCWP